MVDYVESPIGPVVAVSWPATGVDVLFSNAALPNFTYYVKNATNTVALIGDAGNTAQITGLATQIEDVTQLQLYNGEFKDTSTAATFTAADMSLSLIVSNPAVYYIWVGGGSKTIGTVPNDGVAYARMFSVLNVTGVPDYDVIYYQNTSLSGYNSPAHDRTQFSGAGTFTV